MTTTTDKITYRRLDEGTAEEYALSAERSKPYFNNTYRRVLDHLLLLDNGHPGHDEVTQLDHCLQTATRALRGGECEEVIVAALLHDIGDILSPINHPALVAEILSPYVSRNVYWMLAKHAVFQGYYYYDKVGRDKNEREKYRDHPAFELTERFCNDYDQIAFDPDYDNMTLEEFEPIVERVFTREPWGKYAQSESPLEH